MNDSSRDQFVEALSEAQLKIIARGASESLPTQIDANTTLDANLPTYLHEIYCVTTVAFSSVITASHRVAALNALCALIDRCVESGSEDIVKSLWFHDVWNRTFNLYLSLGPAARPKSAKQLLITLTSCLKASSVSEDIKLSISRRLVNGLSQWNDVRAVKAYVLALGHFLNKNVITLAIVLSATAGSQPEEPFQVKQCQHLLERLFTLASEGDFGSAVSQTIKAVLEKASQTDDSNRDLRDAGPLWVRPLRRVVTSDSIDIAQLRIHVFPTLFRHNFNDYIAFLQECGLPGFRDDLVGRPSNGETNARKINENLLCSALQAGKATGLLYETEDKSISIIGSCLQIPVRHIEVLLFQATAAVRLAALTLLVSSPITTRPYNSSNLKVLRRALPCLFGDTDAFFRSEVYSAMQRLIDRLRAITVVLTRNTEQDHIAAQTLDLHKQFVSWLLCFLFWELRPTASYQHHISGLKTIAILLRSGIDRSVPKSAFNRTALQGPAWPWEHAILSPGLRDLLLTLVSDPFDDVRQESTEILSAFAAVNRDGDVDYRSSVQETLSNVTTNMKATARADQADAAAHLTRLLFVNCPSNFVSATNPEPSRASTFNRVLEELERMLEIANADLVLATQQYPLHGHLTCLRYLMTEFPSQQPEYAPEIRLKACIEAVWEIARPVLCNDAPEGFELDEGDESILSSKDTLSYSWRALKESSMLLSAIASRNVTSHEVLTGLSELCFIQLAQLRHRGAFSTVSQTWMNCCFQCNQFDTTGSGSWLSLNYARVLEILKTNLIINTRRSAGIPSLLCGLLIADKSSQLLGTAYLDLEQLASQQVSQEDESLCSLVQVHAMNCIKDILKTSRLAEQSEIYVVRTVKLAANSLRSKAWAVRNCGLMLFRAVIDRLLGTSDAHLEDEFPPKVLSSQTYPELLAIIMDLVTSANPGSSMAAYSHREAVFPALQLISRLQLTSEQAIDAQSAVLELTASESWHIRDKAARTYTSLVDADMLVGDICWLLSICTTERQNAVHGLLLCVRYMLLRLRFPNTADPLIYQEQYSTELLAEILVAFENAHHLHSNNICDYTKASFADALANFAALAREAESSAKGSNTSQGKEQLRKILNYAMSVMKTSGSSVALSASMGGKVDTRDSQLGVATIRKSLTRLHLELLALSATVEETPERNKTEERSNEYLSELYHQDVDAACEYFQTASTMSMGASEGKRFKSLLRVPAIKVLCSSINGELTEVICSALMDISFSDLDKNTEVRQLLKTSTQSTEQATTREILLNFLHPINLKLPQTSIDLQLQLRSRLLNSIFSDHVKHSELELCQVYWLHLEAVVTACLRTARSLGPHTKEAAVAAILNMHAVWKVLHSTGVVYTKLLLDLSIAIYDFLNDDDEDIRLLASRSACRLLAVCSPDIMVGTDLEPLTASSLLVEFMIGKWSETPRFAQYVVERAYSISQQSTKPPAAARLKAAANPDNVLFAEEKQNLYIDGTLELQMWHSVLLRMQPSKIDHQVLVTLCQFILDGLETITQFLLPEAGHEKMHYLSSKPDIFLLGLEIIYGAEFMLHLVEHKRSNLSFRPSSLRKQILDLGKLLNPTGSRPANVLWDLELSRVTSRAILQGMTITGSTIKSVETGLVRK